jgi:hypothetical protein
MPLFLLATSFQEGIFLGLLFDPEEGSDMFFRNVDCFNYYILLAEQLNIVFSEIKSCLFYNSSELDS